MGSHIPPVELTDDDRDPFWRNYPQRPTAETDPADCKWCLEENFGEPPCPYHGEAAQERGDYP